MYKVKLMPENCPSWIHQYKNGDIIDVPNIQFVYHQKHKCMKVIEHYIIITTSKTKCKECGQTIIKRKKMVLK